MTLLLIISFILGLSYSIPCKDATPAVPTVNGCEDLFDDNGCQCSCNSTIITGECDKKEGCDTTICPTTTTDPPISTSTTQITSNTDIPISTTCICPTYSPLTITSPPKSKGSKGSKGAGIGIGECDCKGGIVELRYVYVGKISNVQIDLYTGKNNAELICSYKNVEPNEEIVCNLRGDSPGLIKQGLDKFSTESPFKITYPNNGGICSAQYHTSCSQDIVGVIQSECNELIVSGWKDNENYDNGGDCDGIIPCICDDTPQPTPEPTQDTIQPTDFPTDFPWSTMDEICYCSTNDGNGVGDCDCKGGQIDLKVMYTGMDKVNIKCVYKKTGDELDYFEKVGNGEEITCSVEGNSKYNKLGTDTYIYVLDRNDNEICVTNIHTSCSRNIIGTYGDGNCDNDIIVTGWKDKGNYEILDETYGLGCYDKLEECPCPTYDPYQDLRTTLKHKSKGKRP